MAERMNNDFDPMSIPLDDDYDVASADNWVIRDTPKKAVSGTLVHLGRLGRLLLGDDTPVHHPKTIKRDR